MLSKVIDPSLHSLTYAYVLQAHAEHLVKGGKLTDWSTIWEKMTNFLCTFDGRQMRYAPKVLDQIIEYSVDCARNSREVRLRFLGGH
jgi:COP9 signalosome complex subunit 3